MTFLELCQRVREESGVSGSGPATIDNQQSILQKVVNWVRQADYDIQVLHKDSWKFLWRTETISLIEDQRVYGALDLGLPNLGAIKSMAIAGQPITEVSWDVYKLHGYQQAPDRNQPTIYTVRPDGILEFFAVPDANYVVDVEYQLRPVKLQDDLDEPLIPEQYHQAILQKALMYYANHEEDNDLFQKAQNWYEQALSELASDQLPVMRLNRGNLF